MPRIPLLIIALFFLGGGVGHFIFVDFFVQSMPDYLGYHKELVLISGVFEILGGVGILIPKTRVVAAYGLLALIVAVYPANINMALHPERYQDISVLFLYIRLPLQFLMLWFVWWAIAPERLQNHHA
ncbi:DoxX family protein [Oceanicoccus sp. KOV_DT_Chl]|uniref:DoxX family protein n=1 Tax=Oceanicoccus sp. KOV_DT_Chl TaxID=1904639 RepID=UPI000C7E419C|nr:DoxX family protein [Oceanicoccus sp. KOV_DT_Chl]